MAVNRAGSIRIRGLKELRKELGELDDAKEFERQLKDVHHRIALKVTTEARPKLANIKGKMGSTAAATLNARKTVAGSSVSLGDASAPWALGVEFGAKWNVLRVVKNTRRLREVKVGKRTKMVNIGGRATTVYNRDDLDAVIGRIREQTVTFDRRNTKKGFRGQGAFAVDVATFAKGARSGQTIKMRGWNQFLIWRGNDENAGYAIYPTIKANQTEIKNMYEDEVGKITRAAFPD